MITNRPLESTDVPMLQKALDANTFHPGEKPEWYTGENMYSEVYEDEQGPIGVLRYTKTLRLVTVWCDQNDKQRNAASIIQAIADATEKAIAAGFTEIIFKTNNSALAAFCTGKLGFVESAGEFTKFV
jgi:hypothetical protein